MSIRIAYNSPNENIKFTLAESLSAITSGNTFFIRFEYEQTKKAYEKLLTDISNIPVRYNKFNISTLTGTTGLTTFAFVDIGWYQYFIYQNSNKTVLLESGKAYVFGADIISPTYIAPVATGTTNKFVYKK